MTRLKDSHFYRISEDMDFQIGVKDLEEYPEILTTLYPEHQEVFVLTLQGYGVKEVARKTQLKKETVLWMVHYAVVNARYLIARKKDAVLKGQS